MPATPLVSILVNNFNYGQYVATAIRSALEQDYVLTEVIVVDDGSTDESRERISHFGSQITKIFKDNGGQASALNLGIAEAHGEFILILDSDDYLLPNAISACVRSFPEGYAHIYFRLNAIDTLGNFDAKLNFAIPFVEFDGDAIAAVAKGSSFPATVTTANFFRTSILKTIVPIPEREWRICADNYISILSATQGPIRSINETLGAYRLHGANSWMSRGCLYTDPRRLGLQINNHLRGVGLLAASCSNAGLRYPAGELGDDFWLLHLLCAAKKVRAPVDGDHLPRRVAIARAFWRYLSSAEGRVVTKAVNLLYLSIVLGAPMPLAMHVLRIRYEWEKSRRDTRNSLAASD
jgi:glycosyltransferase involved in cell wall biosynthesis